ncbi:MAG: DinB family protein [Fulvivirga sp.]
MKNHFIDLLRYNDWANSRILITLEESEVDDKDILQLYSHTLSAQIIWLNRIKDIPVSPFPLWETYNLRELRSMTEESSRNWMSFIQAHPNQTFEEMINYQNSAGKKFENTLRQIIAHVINHSTYHRGQLATKLKEQGIQPPATDYIVFARE